MILWIEIVPEITTKLACIDYPYSWGRKASSISMYRQNQAQVPERHIPQMDWKRYFFPQPVPRGSIITCLVGALFLAIGISLQSIVLIASGCLLLLIGASIIGVIIRLNPTDQHYDQWVHAQAQAMLPRALAKFNMRRNQVTDQILRMHSFVLPGSRVASQYPEKEVQAKRGKDGQWRFSINVYTYFLPAEHYLGCHIECCVKGNASKREW